MLRWGGITHPPILPDRAVVGSDRAFVVKVMTPLGFLKAKWSVEELLGDFPLPPLPFGLDWVGPEGQDPFPPFLGFSPHLGCLALALPLRRRPVEVLIDLPLPEEEVAPDVLEGFGESGALVHHLVNLAPCIALCCKQQGGVARGRFPAGYVLPIEPGIPVIQLLLGDPQAAVLPCTSGVSS